MAARITADDVRMVMGGTYSIPDDLDITSQIEMANIIVSEELGTSGLSADRLKMIEKMLAAHFVVVRMNGAMLQEVRLGDGSDQYFDHYGAGLKATTFGQQAIALDTTGKLGDMTATAEVPRKSAQFRVVGPGPNSGQFPVDYTS